MEDFFAFRRMVSPILIRVWFILGAAGIAIGGLIVAADGGYEALARGLFGIIFGILLLRVFSEIFIVVFQINETLTDIRANTLPGRNGSKPAAPRIESGTRPTAGIPEPERQAPKPEPARSRTESGIRPVTGITEPVRQAPKPEPARIKCPNCGLMNLTTSETCVGCHKVLW